MNTEHGHVEGHGDDNETERTSEEVPDEQSGRNPKVAQEIPELLESTEADGCNGEETNPLATDDGTEGETCHDEPDPPVFSECLVVILIAEACPCEGCEGGEEDEWRIEEDMTGLGNQSILKGDEERGEEGGGDTAVECAKREVGKRNSCDSRECRQHAHRDIRHILVGPAITSEVCHDWEGEEETDFAMSLKSKLPS